MAGLFTAAASVAVLAALAPAGLSAPHSATAPLATFPLPQSITIDSTHARPLAQTFKIAAGAQSSSHLDQVIARYSKYFSEARFETSAKVKEGGRAAAAAGDSSAGSASIAGVRVEIATDSAQLDDTTNASYSISLAAGDNTVVVEADNSYGAMYGLETLSQLLLPSSTTTPTDSESNASAALPSPPPPLSLPGSIQVQDHPAAGYRGLTLDVGRRISPITLLENTVQAMSYTKMNVLHLSLSGPVVRLEIQVCLSVCLSAANAAAAVAVAAAGGVSVCV